VLLEVAILMFKIDKDDVASNAVLLVRDFPNWFCH